MPKGCKPSRRKPESEVLMDRLWDLLNDERRYPDMTANYGFKAGYFMGMLNMVLTDNPAACATLREHLDWVDSCPPPAEE
jgi:hypothetical protein